MTSHPHFSRRTFTFLAGISALGTLGGGPVSANVTPRVNCGADKPANPGLLSATEYASPTYGMHVTWDDIWEVGDAANPAVAAVIGDFIQPVDCGTGNGGSDSLVLSHRLAPSSVIRIQIFERGMWTFESMADAMQQPGWVNNLPLPMGSEILLTESSEESLVMLARDIDDRDHIAYKESYFPPDDDEVIMSVTLHMSDPDAYELIMGDTDYIEIEDFTLFSVVSPETLLDAIAR